MKNFRKLFLLTVLLCNFNCFGQVENVGFWLEIVPEFTTIDLDDVSSMNVTLNYTGSPWHTNLPPDQDLHFKLSYYLVELCDETNNILVQENFEIFYGSCIGSNGTGSWGNGIPRINNLIFSDLIANGNYRLKVVVEVVDFMSAVSNLLINCNINNQNFYGINEMDNTDFSDFTLNPMADLSYITQVINSPNAPLSYLLNQNTVNCTNGQANVEAIASGGLAPYSYVWHVNGVDYTQNPIDLSNGNYSLTITDANLCAQTFQVNFVANLPQYDYYGAVIVNSGFNFTDEEIEAGIVRIKGTLIIEENVTESFDNLIFEFADFDFPLIYNGVSNINLPRSGILMQQKSTLTLDNVTLTNVPACNNMWQGIKVQGHATNRLHGAKLVMNNSIVANAHVGVNSGDYISSRFQDFDQYILNGTIEATNSTFKNNNIGINFADSHGEDMPSFIQECDFVCDGPLVDQTTYQGKGSSVFINMLNTRSLPIKASTFTGFSGFDPRERGTAIRSYDANYRVTSGLVSGLITPNTFTNLTKGIDIYSTGSLTNVVHIKDNRFNNVMQGITANNSNFDEISFNEFMIPEGNANIHSWGLNLQACDGFMVTENIFNTLPSSDYSYTYGNISRNISETNGQIYKNEFLGIFQVASQAEQKNNNLDMKCNKYLNENRYDWAITSGELKMQGDCNGEIQTLPAGNIFATCTSSDESQIYRAPFVPSFDYHAHDGLEPLCAPNVNVLTCEATPNNGIGIIWQEACPSQVEVPAGFVIGNGNANVGGQGKGKGKGLSNAEYNQLKAKKIRQELRDGNLNGVLSLIQNSTDQKDIKKLVPTYLAIGDCIKARQKLELIDRTNAEGNEFYLLHDVLVNACSYGRKLKDLNQSEIDQVEQIKNNSNTRVKTGSESILALKNDSQYLRDAEPLVASSQIQTQNEIEARNEKESSFIVFPNPSKGEVNIQTSLDNGILQIVDALGRVHFAKSIADKEVLNLKLETGVYIVTFIDSKGKVETRQLFIQK